jgi:predicted acyltransferase
MLPSLSTVLTTWIGVHFGNVLAHIKSDKRRLLHWSLLALTFLVAGLGLDAMGLKLNKQQWSLSYVCVNAGISGLALCCFYCVCDVGGSGAGAGAGAESRERTRSLGGSLSVQDSAENSDAELLQQQQQQRSVRGWGRLLQAWMRWVVWPLRWVGLNTIFVFVCADGGVIYRLQQWVYVTGTDGSAWNAIDSMEYLLCEDAYSVPVEGDWTYAQNTMVCKAGMFAGHKQKWAQLLWCMLRLAAWTMVAGFLHRHRWYWAL